MDVKLGCMIRPYQAYPVERALEGIARAGFRYTAFLGKSADQAAYDLSIPVSEFRALRTRMEDHGLKAVTAWGGNPVAYGADGMRRHVERAYELGLEYLIISSPYFTKKDESGSPDELLKLFMEALEPALPEAEAAGVRLDVKPHMGHFGTGKGMAELKRRLDTPAFGVSYDPGNIHYYEGLKPEEDLEDVKQFVTSLCVKDHRGAQRESNFPNPGEGDVDWPRIFSLLAEGGFSGHAQIEVLQGASAEEVDTAAARVRERLIEWIEGAGGKVVE